MRLPLNPDGSAVEFEHALKDAGTISGVLWRTKNQTPDIEFDYGDSVHRDVICLTQAMASVIRDRCVRLA